MPLGKFQKSVRVREGMQIAFVCRARRLTARGSSAAARCPSLQWTFVVVRRSGAVILAIVALLGVTAPGFAN